MRFTASGRPFEFFAEHWANVCASCTSRLQPDGRVTMSDRTTPPLALRPREAAKAMGISPRHLWQLTKDGHIPCVRVGDGKRKTVMYPVADLQGWLTRHAAQVKGGK
jgi:excisionase family DNA binding protein